MRQELRKAEICPSCHRITYDAERSVTCDTCGKVLIDELKNGEWQYLDATIFPADHSLETEDVDFCNWACLARWMKQMLPVRGKFGFFKLPYLHPRDTVEFLAELKIIA